MNQPHHVINNSLEYNSSIDRLCSSVVLNKDQWLGECLDDYLFKLCGTDQVVWIPCKYICHSERLNHSFEVHIPPDEAFSCAKIVISNAIRICLIKQHLVKGSQLLPFLEKS
ncbi:hypothetical protein OS175_05885 [Marinicella sp. S1101]|uniref:hypothetical protein n=1 Tax=Marinicella marina TaxID=2996016 RepID=UPI002260BBF0|nr:hypothetical protein [Marinicella marina]MCX7553402.1 hypothetical protein [Marinicella marina]MDJ1140025.1 hypothetical protein [Marinicella marina]